MGPVTSQNKDNKSSMSERDLLKTAWSGIENNPQYHGNVFFLGLCEAHPQYTKYFTLDPEIPLTIDVYVSTHFSTIMETLGYLMVKSYNKPKELNYFINYIAMMHKDMNLTRTDFSNFADSFIGYLITTFPTIMTPECQQVVSRYLKYLAHEVSEKLEEFRGHDPLGDFESARRSSSLRRCLLCNDDSIYGQPVEFWTERQRLWEERLEEWKLRVRTVMDPIKSSSTEDDITPVRRSRIDEIPGLSGSSSYTRRNSSLTSRQLSSFDNVGAASSSRHMTLRTKKSGQTTYDVVEAINLTNIQSTSPTLRLPSDESCPQADNDKPEMISDSATPVKFDSAARRRRRRKKYENHAG